MDASEWDWTRIVVDHIDAHASHYRAAYLLDPDDNNVEALYRRARSPKKIIWLDSPHFSSRNRELSRRITDIIRDELISLQLLNGTHMA